MEVNENYIFLETRETVNELVCFNANLCLATCIRELLKLCYKLIEGKKTACVSR